MAEQLRPCPHCQGSDLKIVPRNWIDGGGVVLTCQNVDCIARIWGHDERDVVARWNRREPDPATKAMLDVIELYRVYRTVSIDELWDVSEAFLAEWHQQTPE